VTIFDIKAPETRTFQIRER